jgi:dTDP-glucose pyrophosphorylase
MSMKGIVLAGGLSSRLNPITGGVSKQMPPIYDKQMNCDPLSVLMLASIRYLLIILTRNDPPIFKRLLGDGSDIGVNLGYAVPPTPGDLAQAFLIGEDLLAGDRNMLVLDDNILLGHRVAELVSYTPQMMLVHRFLTIRRPIPKTKVRLNSTSQEKSSAWKKILDHKLNYGLNGF